MAVGSGVGSSLGVAVETTYGTFVAPARFYEVDSANVKKVKTTVDWNGLAAGRLTNRADGRAVTSKAATGTIDTLVVTNRDMGLLLSLIMGGTPAGTSDAGTPAGLTYDFPLIDTAGKTATVQSGVPDIGGTVHAMSALGCKVTSAEFSCGVDELLTVNVEFDGRDLTEAEALAAASFGTPRKPYHFALMSVKLGADVGSVAAAGGVRYASFKVERALKTDQFYAGGAGLKDEPTTSDKVAVTGTISADYKTVADFADRYTADTQFSLVWEFVGAAINGTSNDTIRFTIPAAFLDTDTPSVSGPDVVTTDFNWKAYDDLSGAGPATITYISEDSAL